MDKKIFEEDDSSYCSPVNIGVKSIVALSSVFRMSLLITRTMAVKKEVYFGTSL